MIRATGLKIWTGFVNVKTLTTPGVLSITRCWIAAWFLSGTEYFFCSASRLDRLGIYTASDCMGIGSALTLERCWSVKLTAHVRVEVQNDGRCTSSPPYALMNYVNALDNARKITLAYFCLSHGGILHTQQQLRSNAFEHQFLFNKTVCNIITMTSQMLRS